MTTNFSTTLWITPKQHSPHLTLRHHVDMYTSSYIFSFFIIFIITPDNHVGMYTSSHKNYFFGNFYYHPYQSCRHVYFLSHNFSFWKFLSSQFSIGISVAQLNILIRVPRILKILIRPRQDNALTHNLNRNFIVLVEAKRLDNRRWQCHGRRIPYFTQFYYIHAVSPL